MKTKNLFEIPMGILGIVDSSIVETIRKEMQVDISAGVTADRLKMLKNRKLENNDESIA